ncbi:MAG: Uma2 family endonuclease [Paraclostridium sp.]
MNNKDYDNLSNLSFYEKESIKNQDTNTKVEFIDGVVTYSSNTSILHNKIVFRLAAKIDDNLVNSKCEVLSDGIEVILEEGERGTYVKPDVFITCNTTYKGQSVTSIPLVVFEVASDGNPENDYERKYKLYRRYGIREYNIIEQNGNIVQFTLQNSFYHVTKTFNKDDVFTSSVFSDLEIDLKQIFR